MDRLKTLSEIILFGTEDYNCLQEAAEKHIKHIKKLEKNNPKRTVITTPLIKWIKYFFELEYYGKEQTYAFDNKDYLVRIEK